MLFRFPLWLTSRQQTEKVTQNKANKADNYKKKISYTQYIMAII